MKSSLHNGTAFPPSSPNRYHQFKRALHKFLLKWRRSSFREKVFFALFHVQVNSRRGREVIPFVLHMIHEHDIMIRRLMTRSHRGSDYQWSFPFGIPRWLAFKASAIVRSHSWKILLTNCRDRGVNDDDLTWRSQNQLGNFANLFKRPDCEGRIRGYQPGNLIAGRAKDNFLHSSFYGWIN